MSHSILVVDDNAMNRELLIEELTHRGYRVIAASSGQDALALLEKMPVHLVILDVMMPQVDGLTVLRTIRESHGIAELPVIMATARTDRGDILEALNLGANDYVTKPIDLPVLVARIRTQLALRDANEKLAELNRDLQEAQAKILQLNASSADAHRNVEAWATAAAIEISELIGADVLVRLEDQARRWITNANETAPGRVETPAPAGTTRVPILGAAGHHFGDVLVSRIPADENERLIIESFAGQLAGALEVRRLRWDLTDARKRFYHRRQEMLDRGIVLVHICGFCGRCYEHGAEVCEDDGAPLDGSQLLPYRLVGRYRLIRRIAAGGMARLFAACDEKLDRSVAVKIIKPEHFNNAEMRTRFEQEARAIARIDHPGVSVIFDSGDLEDGSLFLVMELLHGRNLAQLLEQYGPGSPQQVASLLRQVGAALAAVHDAGFIHRDIKPENIFLVDTPDGFKAKLLDFGIAKPLHGDHGLTQAGTFIGTPAYMAPEQVQESALDVRTDLYSFAAVAYEALVGKRVTTSTDVNDVFREIVDSSPPLVSSMLPVASARIDQQFIQAMAKKKDDRPDSVRDWSNEIASALESLPSQRGWPNRFGRE